MSNDPRQTYTTKAMEALRREGRAPIRPIEFRSQCGEDGLLFDLFGTRGMYIEVGAFNGYDFSVTYALDCMGWSGLLVEPIPARFEECLQRRPSARVIHAALGPPGSDGFIDFTVTEDIHGGMLSRLGTDVRARPGDVQSESKVQVPYTSMDKLLASHHGEIDAAVIDVEGSEVPLLQGFSLERFGPKIVLIEDEQGETPIERHMATRPYQQIGWLAFNRIYARKDLAMALARRIHGDAVI